MLQAGRRSLSRKPRGAPARTSPKRGGDRLHTITPLADKAGAVVYSATSLSRMLANTYYHSG